MCSDRFRTQWGGGRHTLARPSLCFGEDMAGLSGSEEDDNEEGEQDAVAAAFHGAVSPRDGLDGCMHTEGVHTRYYVNREKKFAALKGMQARSRTKLAAVSAFGASAGGRSMRARAQAMAGKARREGEGGGGGALAKAPKKQWPRGEERIGRFDHDRTPWNRDPDSYTRHRKALLANAVLTVSASRGLGRFDVPENDKEVHALLQRNLNLDKSLAKCECYGPVDQGATDFLDDPRGSTRRFVLRDPRAVLKQQEFEPKVIRDALGLTGGWEDYGMSDMLKEGK